MTKKEIYKELEQFSTKDMILINNEVVVDSKNLDDDWFELSDYADDEETGNDYSFSAVKHIDFKDNYDRFETDDYIYETDFKEPNGCVVRFNVTNIIEK